MLVLDLPTCINMLKVCDKNVEIIGGLYTMLTTDTNIRSMTLFWYPKAYLEPSWTSMIKLFLFLYLELGFFIRS